MPKPAAATVAWIALFAGVALAKYGPPWVGAAAWTLWSTPFVWCALAVAVLYSMARARAGGDTEVGPHVNGVIRPVEFVDMAPLRMVQPAVPDAGERRAKEGESKAMAEVVTLQAERDLLKIKLNGTIASLKAIEQRYKLVHRVLRERRERYEGVRSNPGPAEAEIAGIQCEIIKAVEAARR